MLDKNTNPRHSQAIVVYIFSKYVHFYMRFLVEKSSTLLCFRDGVDIAVPVFSY